MSADVLYPELLSGKLPVDLKFNKATSNGFKRDLDRIPRAK